MNRRIAAVLTLVSVGFAARPVRAAERQLQVILQADAGTEATQLCVVGAFVPPREKDADKKPGTNEQQDAGAATDADDQPHFRPSPGGDCGWKSGASGVCEAFDKDVALQLGSNGLCAPQTMLISEQGKKQGEVLWCERKPAASEHGPAASEHVLALKVDAGVTRASLTGSLIELTLDTPIQARANAVAIHAVGGDFLPAAVASHREPDGSDRAILPLRPRCASSHVVIPRYECPPGLPKHPTLTLRNQGSDSTVSFQQLPDVVDIPLPWTESANGGSLELSDCVEPGSNKPRVVMQADWRDQPPAKVDLKPKQFPVRWRRDPLALARCPSKLTLPEVPLVCGIHSRGASPDASRSPLKGDDTCDYQCQSPIPVELPRRALFEEPSCATPPCPAPDNHWEVTVLRPGDTVEGYIRNEERTIHLARDEWPAGRESRIGDGIRSIWIATPDGKVQTVAVATTRLVVPGVSIGDSVTYRYLGDRPFDEGRATVEAGGAVELADPDTLHARGVQPGLAFWGGWRHIGGAKDAAEWNPVGGVELVLAVPRWRRYLLCGSWYIEPEIHVGATVTTQSYESSFQATPSDPSRSETHNVLILVVPIEFTLRAPVIVDQVQFDLGGGIAWYRPFFAEDTSRLAPNIALSVPRMSLLWRLSHSASLGIDGRMLTGLDPLGLHSRRVVETFDLGGLKRREEPDAKVLMFGLVARLDDVF